jgi:hypothetical protein
MCKLVNLRENKNMKSEIGNLRKMSQTWYRVTLEETVVMKNLFFASDAIDIVKDEWGQWDIVWNTATTLNGGERPCLLKATPDKRHVYEKLIAAKVFAQDWANYLLELRTIDPTDFRNPENDKYSDLDYNGRKSVFYKNGKNKS